MFTKIFVLVILLCGRHVDLLAQGSQELKDIQFAYFTSGQVGLDSSGSIAAVEIALDQLNFNSTLLPGYRLRHAAVQNTKCNRSISLRQFLETVPVADPPFLGLLGCGCSVASEPVAEIIHYWNISQIAYVSSLPSLSDRIRFINFFRTHPSDGDFAPAFGSVVKKFEWTRINFVTQDDPYFIRLNTLLQSVLGQNFNTVVTHTPATAAATALALSMNNIFSGVEDYRVIFLSTNSDVARVIMCEALRRKMTYPRYAWLTISWYGDRWWTSEVNAVPADLDCNDDELTEFLDRAFTVQFFPSADDRDMMTDTGLTPNKFFAEYEARILENPITNSTFRFFNTIAYDAVWALALALQNTMNMIHKTAEEIQRVTGCGDDVLSMPGEIVPLEEFNYTNALMGCVIRWNLEQTDFMGLSGHVKFNNVGSRVDTLVKIIQYRLRNLDNKTPEFITNGFEITRVTFGQVNLTDNNTFVYRMNEDIFTVYPQGVPPDGTPSVQIITHKIGLVVSYYLLATLGLGFTTFCLIFNFVYRKKKVVRLTSPNLNYFIIAGSYIMFLSIFIRVIPSTNEAANTVRCYLAYPMNIIAYCLSFGTILVKMCRVYYIFHNPTAKKKVMKDCHLVTFLLLITGIAVFILIIGYAIPSLRPVLTLNSDLEIGFGEDDLGVRIDYVYWHCYDQKNNTFVVFILSFVYFALLQVIGIVLAIQTSRVKIKALNDSKFIAALIYISSLDLFVLFVISFAPANYFNIYEALFSGGLLIFSAAFLGLMFIPKMVSLYRDPHGEKIFTQSTYHDPTSQGNTIGNSISKDNRQTVQLQSRIEELELELHETKLNSQTANATITQTVDTS